MKWLNFWEKLQIIFWIQILNTMQKLYFHWIFYAFGFVLKHYSKSNQQILMEFLYRLDLAKGRIESIF